MVSSSTTHSITFCGLPKSKPNLKFRRLFRERVRGAAGALQYRFAISSKGDVRPVRQNDDLKGDRLFGHFNLKSQTASASTTFEFEMKGYNIPSPRRGGWKTNAVGMSRLLKADRIMRFGNTPEYVRYFNDAPYLRLDGTWLDTSISGFGDEKRYIVQTLNKAIQRCILMTTDLATSCLTHVWCRHNGPMSAEQWGRR